MTEPPTSPTHCPTCGAPLAAPPTGAPSPAWSGVPAPNPPTNGFAIASLVLGIVWIWGLGSVLAIVFGSLGLRQIRERGDGGRGLAIAGVVLGTVGIAGLILFLLFAVAFTSAIGHTPPH